MLQDITDDEILNITSLYIDSCGINDLTGLRCKFKLYKLSI